jgi:hypothetical protein
MERVAFLLESTGERIGCMLNPEKLLVRRLAGIQPRRSAGGLLGGANLTDDPLIYRGGGTTELQLDLLFDVSIAGSSIDTDDVRELTFPLWSLAENASGADGQTRPQLARFVWGKSWNVPGIVAAVSERLECFTPGGAPARSWLRMRFLRVAAASNRPDATQTPRRPFEPSPSKARAAAEQAGAHQVAGSATARAERVSGAGERLDEIAYRYYGNAALWKPLAAFNGLDDPARVAPGCLLQIPPPSALEGAR